MDLPMLLEESKIEFPVSRSAARQCGATSLSRIAISNAEERYNDSHTPLAERHRAEYDFHDGFLARSHAFSDTLRMQG